MVTSVLVPAPRCKIVPMNETGACARRALIWSDICCSAADLPRPTPLYAREGQTPDQNEPEDDHDAPLNLAAATVRLDPEHALDPVGRDKCEDKHQPEDER